MSEIDRLLDGAPEYNPDAAKKPKAMAAAPRSESDELLKDAPSQARGFGGWARDVAATAVKGAIAVPEAAVGLADIPTGGRVGKALQSVGFDPKAAREVANDWHSDATKDAQRKFQESDGIWEKTKTAVQNPSLIATAVGESLPVMGLGGVAARGLLAGTRLGQMGTSAAARVAAAGGDDAAQAAARIAGNAKGAALAGAAGEGATMAGSAAEQIRQETEDGRLTPGQTAAALATGAVGTLFGYGGGRLASRLGIGDADTMIAQGAKGIAGEVADDAAAAAARAAANPLVAQAAVKSIPRKIIEGAISEGFLEELPQSVAEQVFQNLALGKPWHEDVDSAIVLGTLSGGAMGAGAAGYRGFMEPGRRDVPPAPPAPAPAPPMLGNQPDPPVIFPDGTIGRSAEVEAYINSLPEDQRVEARAKLRGLGPQPAPAPAPIKPSEAMGLNPAQGSLSTAAAVAVDSGVTGQMEQAAAEAQQLEQAAARRRADSPVLDYADLDDADRAAYDDYFNTVSEQTDDHLAAAMLDDDIPDFGAESNISEVEFLRRLGASEQEILDAIQAASPAGGPQAGAFGATETQAHVTDSAQPAAGADQGPGSSQEAAKSIADSAYQPIASALQAELDAEAADDIPDTAFARVTEDAGEPDIPATTKGQNDGAQADRAQQAQPQRAQGGTETGDAAAAQGVPAAGAGGAGVQAAGLTDGATADVRGEQPAGRGERGGADAGAGVDAGLANRGGAGAPVDAAGVGRAGAVPVAPYAAGEPAAGAVANGLTTIKDIGGKSVTVRAADLAGDKPLLRTFTKDGKARAARIHRDNLDPTGEKRAANAKQDAENPLFNVITRKDGGVFASQPAANAELARRGMGATHEVVPTSEVKPGAPGFVIRKKVAANNIANNAQPKSAGGENDTKTEQAATPADTGTTTTKNVADSAVPASAGAGIDAKKQEKAIERVNAGKAYFFSREEADAFVADNGLAGTHEVKQDGRAFHVKQKAQAVEPADVDAGGRKEIEAAKRRLFDARRRAAETSELDANARKAAQEKVSQIEAEIARLRRQAVLDDDAVTAAANEAATSPQNDLPEPTQAQKEAGNYTMGHLSGDAVQGLNITIENPKGSVRSGTSPDGRAWSNTMAAHYGYVKRSEAADGDHVDIFVGPDAATAPTVWVVDQTNPDGSYDEAKILFGFNTEAEALAAYKGSYDAGWKVGPVTALSVDELKAALADGRLKKPLSEAVDGLSKSDLDKAAAIVRPKAPTADKPAEAKPSADQVRAKADLMNALADLGDILGKNTRMNIMPEQEQKLLPVLTRLLDAAFRLGYHKFKDAAKFSLDQIRQHLGDEAADALTLDHMQGAYIAMSGGKQGVDTKRAVIDVETKAEIEAHEANTAEPEADTIEAPQDAPLRTSDGAPTAATGRVDRPSQGALGGIPADPVQGTSGGREAGGIAARGRDADQRGNADPDGPGDAVARSVGDGARDVPVPTGGRRSGPVRGRGNASGGRVSGTAPGDDAATATGRPGRLSEPAQPELGGINPAGGPNLAPNAPPIEAPQLTDFTITDDFALGEGGQKTKFKANVAAIRLAKELDANPNRVATQEEQRVLARYVGWGGLAQAFDANNKDWSREHAELRELLNDDEYADAARSTRYAHYTSREVVVDGVYAAMRRFGFTGGKTLEAGAGVGNFLGLMPADMRSAGRFTAIERDRLSSTIARHLYPQQNVQRADFTQFKGADGYFDAAVGNPPFASDTQTDQSGRKHLSGLSLHNYFFAKAVDMLRPGGVMAQVVTSSFLDAKGDAARRYIGERTVFLGAIRLPNNAFSKNAGTEVTTDIIFLQKRPDADIGSKKAKQEAKAWQDTAEFTDASGKKVPLNQYFIDHPNMMLGDFGAHGTMYGPDQPALVARPGQDTSALLREAVQRLPEGVYTPAAAANTASQHKAAMEALKNPAVQEGGYFIDGDRLMQRLPDVAGESFAAPITPETQWTEKQALGESRFDRIRRLAQLRTTLRELIAAEMGSDDARMGALRAQLNEQYDAFQAEHGYISGRLTKLVFEDDPDYPLLLALESDYNPGISVPAAKKAGVKAVKPSAKKAPIFSRRVVAARKAVRKVDTPIDALAVSMAERGRLDAGYIGDLLGRDPQEVLQELASGEKPAIFRDPATDEYVLRDAYLSGNVRAKLAQAIAAGERANVRALEEVQPEDVPASEIVARIGSPWVPKTVYEAFAAHLFGDETAANVRYIKENGSFLVAIKPGNQVAYTATYGTPKMDGGDILAALLNNRPIRVTYRDEEGRTHVDQDATDKANEKAQAIRDKFQDWLFTDGDRAEVLVRAYNDTNNNYVTRVYDGDRMTFPGKVPDEIVKFRRHQRNAIARTVQDRTALYDHVVGAGKTYTVIASAMELRRTGLAKKPMIAVPNHLVKQWAADFYRLYPGANILTATKKDFERENRRKFLAKAATGDWDAIIIAHSSFGFIRSAQDFEEQFNRKEIAKIVAAIEAVESDDDSDKQQKRRTVKQLEGLKERLENRIKALRDRPMDDLLDFDQIGVDQLFVDEFHLFKNLMFSTKMQNVQGLGDPTGSQRAYDMLLKIGQIFQKNGRDQGFVAATGTPVSNSLAEMYHMMRYLMPTQMEALGFTSFDAWANTFASVEQVWMQKPSGEGFKASSRMSTFVNTPELLKMFDQVSDTVTMDNIKAAFSEENDGAEFPLPKLKGGRRTPISLTKTPAQEAYMKELADRAKAVEERKGPPKKGEDNVLVIMSDGRKAAMDMRLVDLDRTERDPGGRVDRASDEIVSRYKQFDGVKGTQLVFSDMGTPISQAKAELKEYAALRERIDAATEDVRTSAALGDEAAMDVLQDADAAQDELDAKGQDWLDSVRAAERGFSVYDDLRKALIEKGVKPEEIAFIHEANTDEQKAALFRKVNSGEIRVLMGSTQKMGAGTNVQERLVALHHLDVPWKPSDVEQREGRIIRQGNRLAYGPEAIPDFEVEILGYVTQDTLDMRMWQIQETKLKMINQLRTRTVAREMENAFEDMEMSAGEMQAAATGNMDLLREIQLRSDVKKLEQRKRAFDASRADLESRRRRNAAALEALPPQIEAARGPAEKVRAYQAKASEALDAFKATIDGKEYDNWREAQEYLRELNDRKVQTTNDKGETVEKAAPLDVTINSERYTARAAMAEAFQSLRGDVEPIIWDVGGKALRTRSEIEKAIRQPVVDAIADKNQQQVGTIAGFDVVVEGSVDAYGNSLEVVLLDGGKEVDSRSTTVQDSTRAHGWVVKSVDGMVRGAGHAVADLEARLKRAQKEAADLATTENTGEWPDTAKLEKARADHKEVLKRLAGEGKPENQPQAAPAANEDDAYMGERRAARQGTHTDRAVMDMLREGREAKEVLRLIAGTSKSRFNRQIARLLIRTGISPTMEALPGAGLGYDKRGFALLAKFNRSSNTVTLTDGAGYMAEQIVLHELIHAATLAALDRKGLHSLQMRRLFEHVRKHGGLAGTYGMKNVGEFTSEAFTNPDFQRELRKIKGVQDGGAIKTAWDGFIRILRSILGLRNDSTDALSQALQIGVGVMRDQYRMGNRGERGGHNAYMATRNVAGQDSASDDSDTHMGAPTHGYLDGKPYNPQTEQLSAEQRKLIVGTFNANTSGEKVTTTGAVESSGDIGAKSRAFQALAAAEGWTVHRDQIGAKYFNVNKGGRDGINIAVRVSDHSNVNRGIHFKESAINLAPNDGRAAFDDFESALWKLRNAGEDEDGNLTFGGDEPDYFFGAADVRALKDSAMQRVTGNNGNFDPANADIRYRSADLSSRAGMADLTSKAREELNKTFGAPGKLSWWHKTVGTMYNLAERSPAFKRVFEAAQGFVDDVSYYATDAAEQAPRLLPKLETWRDIAKRPITAADNAAVAKPVFEGTLVWTRDEAGKPVRVDDLVAAAEKLTAEEKARSLLRQDKISAGMLRAWQGLPLEQYEKLVESRYESQMLKAGIVWTPAELKSMFKLTDDQVALYKEFRAATDRSLDTMARSDMLRYGGKDVADLRDMVMDAADAQDAAQILRDHLQMLAKENPERAGELGQLSSGMLDRAAKVQELQEQGYAPLSRFGKYTVDVVDANGERQYFGLFETQREANIMAMKMRKGFGQDAVSQGTLSNEEFKLLAGITPESLELFGNMLGLDSTGDDAQDKAFQEYLRRTKTNRSAMRRLIHRQGIAGYSEDVGRVLASFIYSNARQTSAGLHMGELGEAVTAIPKQQGELKDAAVQLSEYVKNPQEEAQAIRGLLFAQYLGGSIASAVVNMSQPAAVTLPWLSQFGGARQAAAELGRAAKNLANKGHRYEADLAAALKHAEEEGTVSPQEVHQLMAQARGSGSLRPGDGTRTGDALASAGNALTRLSLAWGKVFGAAEQVNRRMTYIAAFRIAKAQKMANPAAFAKKAVIETQFTYSKANKMKWGRGAVGATVMTFKTYSIAYLELLGRMWTQGEPGSQERKDGRKAVLLALGMLMLMGGAGGLPFAEDAEDLVDGLAQLAGYNFNSKKAKQELLESVFGQAGAGFVERGITGLPGMPLDVSGRLGMGNLIPATGLFKEKTDYTRDVLEVVGPVGDLAKRVATGTRSILGGDVGAGLLQMAPAAARNWAKGADMAVTGMYRDDKGYKVLDTSPAEAAMKFIGFQPASVSKVQEANFINQQAKNFYNMKAQEIRAKWARGIFEKDQGIVAEARADLEEWNRKNPEQRIVVSMPAVLKRVREMSKTKDQRIADTAPRAMRQQMREETEKARATL